MGARRLVTRSNRTTVDRQCDAARDDFSGVYSSALTDSRLLNNLAPKYLLFRFSTKKVSTVRWTIEILEACG